MKLTKDYFDARRAAIRWLKGTKPYLQGVQILQQSGYKPFLVNKLLRRPENTAARQKLEYEMRIMIQMWNKPDDPIYEDEDVDEGAPAVGGEQMDSILREAEELAQAESDEQTFPPVVQKLIYSFSDVYKQRSILQHELGELGETNSDEVLAARKVKVDKIKDLSVVITQLDVLYDNFKKNGVVPTDKDVVGAMHVNSGQAVVKAPSENKEDDVLDLASMSVDELKKLLKNEQTKLTRARNQLLYGQDTVPDGKVENPMPDSPKKVKYTRKVEKLTATVERIKYRLAELA